ncbi:MAG: hypothetical protein OXI87_10155 [Albidovulum sp.]|nr:hypothetical protein [Albidovulum sp.]
MAAVKPVSLASGLGLSARTLAEICRAFRRDGLLVSDHFECGAFIRSKAGVEHPHL